MYVDIQDNGIGVQPEILDSISQIPKSSHGLGLPMVYRIIHVHGGRFTAENDNGLKIRMELPTV